MALTMDKIQGWYSNGDSYIYPAKNDLQGVTTGYLPNQNKVLHLAFTRGQFVPGMNLGSFITGTLSTMWDNWKTGKAGDVVAEGGNNASGNLIVPSTVNPIIGDFSIKGGFNIGTKNIVDAMKEGGGKILGTLDDLGKQLTEKGRSARLVGSVINNAGAVLEGDTKAVIGNAIDGSPYKNESLVSKFSEFPIFDADATSYVSPGSITLEFRFGNGGIFDGEVEVVRPIAILESLLAPKFVSNNSMIAPMASPSMLYSALWGASIGSGRAVINNAINAGKQIGADIADVGSSLLDGEFAEAGRKAIGSVETIGGEAEKLGLQIQETVIQAQDFAVNHLIGSTVLIFLRLGSSIIGPLYVSSVNHSLDYSTVDERGYPTKGTISLDVAPIAKPSHEDIMYQFGYRTDPGNIPNNNTPPSDPDNKVTG